MSVLPSVGMTGVWELAVPLANYLDADAVYVCRAVRAISDYIAEGSNPYTSVYQPVGLSESDYDIHYANNESIVSLQALDGTWVFIPVPYILRYPNTSGVAYDRKAIILSFPILPSNTLFTHLIDEYKTDALAAFGVDIEAKIVPMGHQYILSHEDAQIDEDARGLLMTGLSTASVRIQQLETENQKLKDLLQGFTNCVSGMCLTGSGFCLKTFNPKTPGAIGYINGVNLHNYLGPYRDQIIPGAVPQNAVDLFMYGSMIDPFGRLNNPYLPETSRGAPFTPAPTPIETGLLPVYPVETQPNVTYPVTAGDLTVEPPSAMVVSLGLIPDQDAYTSRSPAFGGSIVIPEYNTDRVGLHVRIVAPYQNIRQGVFGQISPIEY